MSSFNRVRVLFSDHLNLARGKYVPARFADKGVSRHCLALFALGYDREMTPAPGTKMLEGLPDLEAVYQPDEIRTGWEKDTGVVIADLEREGQPLPLCPRQALKRAVADWDALGYMPKLGIEFEAYVFKWDEANRAWAPYDTPGAYVYGTGKAVDPEGLIDAVWEQSEACGFNLEFINSEYDFPQFEFTMKYDDALKAIDEAFLFRLMAREVLLDRGYLLSFMPKPINGRGGTGLHFNMSFWDGNGQNWRINVSRACWSTIEG